MANPSADLSVGKLADMVAMSEKTLSRAFKQKTGQTVGEFVLSVRLSYACEMLKAGERKIKDIARLSGLGSQTNMRQLFMTRFGCSPTAYRDGAIQEVNGGLVADDASSTKLDQWRNQVLSQLAVVGRDEKAIAS